MDRLCTPWRFDYVTGKDKEEGCVFCNRLDCDSREHYVLYRGAVLVSDDESVSL